MPRSKLKKSKLKRRKHARKSNLRNKCGGAAGQSTTKPKIPLKGQASLVNVRRLWLNLIVDVNLLVALSLLNMFVGVVQVMKNENYYKE